MIQLSALYIYPVKSLAGFQVTSAEVDELGLAGDRRFMVVDENHRFLTQRALPRMALIRTALTVEKLTLSIERGGSIDISRRPDASAAVHNVSIWKSEGLLAEDCGDNVSAWLSDVLEIKCRLVRIGEKFRRPILKANIAGPGDVVNFADAFPFLLISEASLADLNDRLTAQGSEVVPMNRFRPNLVVSGCAAYSEDGWSQFRIGEIAFRAGGPCSRCSVTTVDQETAKRGPEPLRTLSLYRRDAVDAGAVNFGQNVIHQTKRGTLRIGDTVGFTS